VTSETGGARPRVVWAAGDHHERLDLLRSLAPRAELHVVSGALPPGSAPLEEVPGATGEGADWLWQPYPLSFIRGATRAGRVLFALAGRPDDAVRFRDRDRELARVVLRTTASETFDVIVADGPGIVAHLRGAAVPIYVPAGEQGDGGGALDRSARERWTRRVHREPIEVVTPRSLVDRLVAVEAGAVPSRRAAPRLPIVTTASVVLATAGRAELVRRSLPGLVRAAERVAHTEVIVVEQGAATTSRIAGELGVEVVVVHDDGHGASRGRNIGAARACGDIVLFTDDDCLVPEGWVEDHLAAFAERGAEDVVGSFGQVTGLTRAGEHEDPVALGRRHGRGALPWHIGHGSNMAVRREQLLAVGGWDERLGPGTPLPAGEDADLIARLLTQGSLRSGTGEPVAHIEWRSADAEVTNLRAYEFGAGVWIGKALRRSRRDGVAYIRARHRLLRQRWHLDRSRKGGRRLVVRASIDFVRGLARGVALR
jgi:glycosyltransferase involved in cell wall biosynthesis